MPKFSDAAIGTALMGRRAITPYPFPTLDGVEFGLRLLTDGEQDAARLQAQRYCKDKSADLLSDPQFMDRALMRYTLLAACFNVDAGGGKLFSSHDELLQLDVTLLHTLYGMYETHRVSIDPLLYCSAEEVDGLVAALGKGEIGLRRLSLYDLSTLRAFVLSMASRLRSTPPTPNSSTTSDD